MKGISALKNELKNLSNPKQATILQRFFKTDKGQYGEGDIFLGIKVPVQRQIAKKYQDLPIKQTFSLLKSKVHEHRLTALFILIFQYERSSSDEKNKIFNHYLKHTKYINNWDLVDVSAPKIVGDYLLDKPRDILYKLARSNDLWEKRISILATLAFIRNNQPNDTLKIAKILLEDKHDLIHKAVGWMLRELGKTVSKDKEIKFLRDNKKNMPRTMLRYAIEKFNKKEKKELMA